MSLTRNKDINLMIMSLLNDTDLSTMSQVNKASQKLCNDETFWMKKSMKVYGKYLLEHDIDIRTEKNKEKITWKEYYIQLTKLIIKCRKDRFNDQHEFKNEIEKRIHSILKNISCKPVTIFDDTNFSTQKLIYLLENPLLDFNWTFYFTTIPLSVLQLAVDLSENSNFLDPASSLNSNLYYPERIKILLQSSKVNPAQSIQAALTADLYSESLKLLVNDHRVSKKDISKAIKGETLSRSAYSAIMHRLDITKKEIKQAIKKNCIY